MTASRPESLSQAAYRYVISLATAIEREPAVRLEMINPLRPERVCGELLT